jgi:hypothetical protein
MESTSTQFWYYLLELRRDLTQLQIDVLDPMKPYDGQLGTAQKLAKLQQELAKLNSRLANLQQTIQHPSI